MLDIIINELNNFNTLPYCFKYRNKEICVILGGHSSKKSDEYSKADMDYFNRLISCIEDLFEKENITENEKIIIGEIANKIRNSCNYKVSTIYTIEEQKEFLKQFDSCALKNLYKQIQMYKVAFKYYSER